MPALVGIKRTHGRWGGSCMSDTVQLLLSASDCAHNVGSDELYRPADARICHKVGVLLCAACVDEGSDGRGPISNDVN